MTGRARVGDRAPHLRELRKPQPDGTLVKALARACRWQGVLDAGIYASVRAMQRTAALWL